MKGSPSTIRPGTTSRWFDRRTAVAGRSVRVLHLATQRRPDARPCRSIVGPGLSHSLNQAKVSYLEPMLDRYPDGEHTTWAQEQLDRVEMVQAEHALSVKLKRNLPLKNEAERLYAEASEFERFGDIATALDQYRSMETLLADDTKYRPYVNLARRQIARIEFAGVEADEAARIIESKLDQADELMKSGKVIAARQIWYSLVELYGNNDNVAPLVAKAQERLAGNDSNGNDNAP